MTTVWAFRRAMDSPMPGGISEKTEYGASRRRPWTGGLRPPYGGFSSFRRACPAIRRKGKGE
ncbi:MAG: hypothetical protein LBS70_02955 [Candidatus Accumulibacter sp.]|nr:hypothetical protein [Accumulibacter sp.]